MLKQGLAGYGRMEKKELRYFSEQTKFSIARIVLRLSTTLVFCFVA